MEGTNKARWKRRWDIRVVCGWCRPNGRSDEPQAEYFYVCARLTTTAAVDRTADSRRPSCRCSLVGALRHGNHGATIQEEGDELGLLGEVSVKRASYSSRIRGGHSHPHSKRVRARQALSRVSFWCRSPRRYPHHPPSSKKWIQTAQRQIGR